MKTISAIEILLEARKYTNDSAFCALIRLANKVAEFGRIGSESPVGYGELKNLIEMEHWGTTEEQRKANYELIPVSEYAKNLTACNNGVEITEQELLEELVSAGVLSSDEESEELSEVGAPLEYIDKGYVKLNKDGTIMISHFAMAMYQEWKMNGGENYFKKHRK